MDNSNTYLLIWNSRQDIVFFEVTPPDQDVEDLLVSSHGAEINVENTSTEETALEFYDKVLVQEELPDWVAIIGIESGVPFSGGYKGIVHIFWYD